MAGFLHVLRDLALLIARVCLGGVLILHGWRRWQIEGIARQTGYLSQFGIPNPQLLTWGATVLELTGGLFLIFGLLTPLVALAVVVEQGMIIAWTRWFRGPYLNQDGWEYNAILASLALVLTTFGAGRAAMDQLFKRSRDDDDADLIGPSGSTGSTVFRDRDPA